MKYSPDAYLLHESNRFITFNIRIKVVMKDAVDAEIAKLVDEKNTIESELQTIKNVPPNINFISYVFLYLYYTIQLTI